MAPRLLSRVTEGCLVAKWLSHFLQTFSLGTGWTINFFFNMSNSEPSCIRIFANMNLQYQVYTKNVYFSDQDHDGALIKYRTELNLSALGNHHTWLICHIISFVHSTCLGLLNIDQNRSKTLKFWLPCPENNCSAWHLNKTLILKKINKHNAH